jgi:hypothetical protein
MHLVLCIRRDWWSCSNSEILYCLYFIWRLREWWNCSNIQSLYVLYFYLQTWRMLKFQYWKILQLVFYLQTERMMELFQLWNFIQLAFYQQIVRIIEVVFSVESSYGLYCADWENDEVVEIFQVYASCILSADGKSDEIVPTYIQSLYVLYFISRLKEWWSCSNFERLNCLYCAEGRVAHIPTLAPPSVAVEVAASAGVEPRAALPSAGAEAPPATWTSAASPGELHVLSCQGRSKVKGNINWSQGQVPLLSRSKVLIYKCQRTWV